MIFISYNHNDEEIVDQIVKRLDFEFGRKNIFYDKWSIQPGDSIIGKMNEGIEKADVFFYFLSSNSLKSKIVSREWQSALMQSVNENLKFIPIRIEDCQVPSIMKDILFIDLFNIGIIETIEKMKVCISGSNEYDYLEEVDNIIANLVTISDNELEFEIQAEKFIVPNPTFAFFCENKLGTVHYKPISDGLINRNEGEAIDNFSKKTLEGWSVLILELIRPLTPQKSFKGKIYTQEDTLKFKFLQQMVSETEVKNIPCYI